MSKGKREKFAELETFPNVFQNFNPLEPRVYCVGEERKLKGCWHHDIFENDHPIVAELACGKGEYAVNLAKAFPDKNFVGIDVKGNRIWKGAKKALEAELSNVAFLRIRIETMAAYFAKGELDEVWITFPDPFPRKSKAKRRLTSPRFLEVYRKVLISNGLIHLKTDATSLFEYTLETLQHEQIEPETVIWDVHGMEEPPEVLQIRTFYEELHLEAGKQIHYLNFRLP